MMIYLHSYILTDLIDFTIHYFYKDGIIYNVCYNGNYITCMKMNTLYRSFTIDRLQYSLPEMLHISSITRKEMYINLPKDIDESKLRITLNSI